MRLDEDAAEMTPDLDMPVRGKALKGDRAQQSAEPLLAKGTKADRTAKAKWRDALHDTGGQQPVAVSGGPDSALPTATKVRGEGAEPSALPKVAPAGPLAKQVSSSPRPIGQAVAANQSQAWTGKPNADTISQTLPEAPGAVAAGPASSHNPESFVASEGETRVAADQGARFSGSLHPDAEPATGHEPSEPISSRAKAPEPHSPTGAANPVREPASGQAAGPVRSGQTEGAAQGSGADRPATLAGPVLFTRVTEQIGRDLPKAEVTPQPVKSVPPDLSAIPARLEHGDARISAPNSASIAPTAPPKPEPAIAVLPSAEPELVLPAVSDPLSGVAPGSGAPDTGAGPDLGKLRPVAQTGSSESLFQMRAQVSAATPAKAPDSPHLAPVAEAGEETPGIEQSPASLVSDPKAAHAPLPAQSAPPADPRAARMAPGEGAVRPPPDGANAAPGPSNRQVDETSHASQTAPQEASIAKQDKGSGSGSANPPADPSPVPPTASQPDRAGLSFQSPPGTSPPMSSDGLVPAASMEQAAPVTDRPLEAEAGLTQAKLSLTRQIVHALPTQVAQEVELVLSPEELGRVQMVMLADGDSVTLRVHADRAETLDLMRRSTEQLLQELRSSGFSSVSLEFGQGRRHPPPNPQLALPAQPYGSASHVVEPSATTTPTRTTATGGLDLRL